MNSMQARFELDEDYQKTAVLRQMGCLWRSHKSLVVKDILNATNNQQRMNLRPKHINPIEWRKFVKVKTSPAFKVLTELLITKLVSELSIIYLFNYQIVSDKYKERRSKQIPHTTSRKGMVRLTEEMVSILPYLLFILIIYIAYLRILFEYFSFLTES